LRRKTTVKIDNFFSELKRRNVYKVAVAYAIVGWLLIQIATQVFPFFEIPNWAVRLIVLAIVIGFPIALIIAWAFELTPEGLKRTEDVGHAAEKRGKSHAWIYVVAVGAVLSIGLFFFGRYSTGNNLAPRPSETGSSVPQKSIAVLPFENLSEDKANAYFADGIQNEILTKLATIADLKVISRTSTAKYKSKPEDLKTVSQQLGVATVLEGSVQKAGDKVRVNVQLIDARSDSHLWARSYDGDAKDVFGVETEVSQQVADALRAKLSSGEINALATAPTRDPEAYDLFLKAEYEHRAALAAVTVEAYERAAAAYEQALKRDPNFALAAARQAEVLLTEHWFTVPFDSARLAQVRATIDHALSIAPELAEVHVALGDFYYHGEREYEKALTAFRHAIELQPNHVQAREMISYVYRRQGQWERSVTELAKVQQLDPRNPEIAENLSVTYTFLRQWSDAKRVISRALALEPNSVLAKRQLFLICINGDGDIEAAQRSVADLTPGLFQGQGLHGTLQNLLGEPTYFHVLRRDFEAALKEWEKQTGADPAQRARKTAGRLAIRLLAGKALPPKAEIDEARTLVGTGLPEQPYGDRTSSPIAWLYLALGQRADAIAVAHRAADSLPIEKDAPLGAAFTTGLAEIQAQAGQPRDAIAILRRLLSIPAGAVVSINRLKLDPVWDPIRNDPGFQQLLAGKEQIGPIK
jgi:TolB-like protein/Flp pilus assembly protein TadD